VAQSAGGSTPCVAQEPEICASGISPEEAVRELTRLRGTLPRPLSAVGEIGLDAHYGVPEDAPVQRALFERQVTLAAEWGLPVVVHCREAESAVLEVLRSAGSKELAGQGRLGVLHCFVGDADFARAVLDLGMMVSFSGILTFRNADALRAVAKTIPRDRLLIETDSPYLAPVPFRGKVNEPAYVEHTLRRLAEVRSESEETLAAATCANARRLFDTPSGDRP
jgi:TatD DNase family protein